MKKLISLLFSIILMQYTYAENDTLVVHTTTVCEMCKETIEKELSFERGVKRAEVDLKANSVIVIYNPEKITPEKIRIAITKIGYDADSLKADAKAYERLPDCCRKAVE